MTYQFRDPGVGLQAIATTSATQNHKLGDIRLAADPTFGMGEFIYLLGVTGTIVGSCVTWNSATYQTSLCAATANTALPVAFAMSANVGSQYGWYQISGVAIAAKTCTVSIPVGQVAVLTAGLVAKSASGKELIGANCTAIASNKAGRTTATLMIQRPDHQGRIT